MKKNSIIKYLILTGVIIVILLSAVLWIKNEKQPHNTVVEVEGSSLEKEIQEPARVIDDIRPGLPDKEEAVEPAFPADTAIRKEVEKTADTAGSYEAEATEYDDGITPEQEFHYQMTQMFIAEAKESLPLIGIRAFNAREAWVEQDNAVSENTADSAADNAENNVEENGEIPGTDMRGLKDGEVWIRINAGDSGEHKEIMAQVADLYRSNMNFAGDVTVLLWVGGQPIERQTYSLQSE